MIVTPLILLFFSLNFQPVPLHDLKGIMLLEGQPSCASEFLTLAVYLGGFSQEQQCMSVSLDVPVQFIVPSYSNPLFCVLELS